MINHAEAATIELWQTNIPADEQTTYRDQGLALLSGAQPAQLLRLTGRLLVSHCLQLANQPFSWADWQARRGQRLEPVMDL